MQKAGMGQEGDTPLDEINSSICEPSTWIGGLYLGAKT